MGARIDHRREIFSPGACAAAIAAAPGCVYNSPGLIPIYSHRGTALCPFFSRRRQTVARSAQWRQLEQSLKIYDA
jgi:hypothetical protein